MTIFKMYKDKERLSQLKMKPVSHSMALRMNGPWATVRAVMPEVSGCASTVPTGHAEPLKWY